MSAGQLAAVLNHVHGLIAAWHSDGLTDGQLLEAYLARQDASAFAALVRRHGSVVLSICRNVLHNEHDAEDAFQAAFLILARKAEAIRRLASIGGWLCKVAYNVALKARASRRPVVAREPPEASLSDPLAALVRLELCEALAEELARLPDKFRQPLVLCYLEGLTTGETAQRLCWPTGTVKVRLMQARELLRKRLGQRGFSLSAAGLISLLTVGATSAAVPVALVTAGVSAQAVQLAEGFFLAAQTTKFQSVLVGLLVVGLLLAGAGGLAYRDALARGAAELPLSQPTPRVSQAGIVANAPADGPFAIDDPSAVFHHESPVTAVAASPDGQLLAAAGTDGRIMVWDGTSRQALVAVTAVEEISLLPDDTESTRQKPPSSVTNLVFPNDRTLAAMVTDPSTGTAVILWDAHTGKEQGRYPTQRCFAFGADGTLLVTTGDRGLVLWDVNTGRQQALPDLTTTPIQAVVLGSDRRTVVMAEEKRAVRLGDLISGRTRQRLQVNPDVAIPRPRAGVILSPDGRYATIGGSWEGTLPLWEVATGRELREMVVAPGLIHSVVFSADGSRLAVAARDESIRVLDVLSGKTSLLIEQPHDEAGVTTLGFAPDGKTLISAATDGGIHCWPLP
jgi:RNA polymerase sigma factor (sigma-70 family)